MKAVYLEQPNKELRRFIYEIKEEKDDDCDGVVFADIDVISEKAFASSCIEQALFEKALRTIKKEAFKDCECLGFFCCGKVGGDTKMKKSAGVIKGIGIYESKINTKSEFVIETSAFAGCDKLHTVILPRCKMLKIEKNAFGECSSLRTVVALAQEIKFTDNPFSDCPKDLTFICDSASDVERFARENGYRYING